MHPDKEGGSEAAFTKVSQAHGVLVNPEMRVDFDYGKDLNKFRGPEDNDTYRPGSFIITLI